MSILSCGLISANCQDLQTETHFDPTFCPLIPPPMELALKGSVNDPENPPSSCSPFLQRGCPTSDLFMIGLGLGVTTSIRAVSCTYF